MKVGIIVFPGSNCDRDMLHVLKDVYHLDASLIWHEDRLPGDMDAIVLPGGFSYGDRLRAGIIAAHSPIIPQIKETAGNGVPVLGVCNGFQILTEAGLLPGALIQNRSQKFMCQWVELQVENCSTPFTRRMYPSQRIPVPIANGEGRYFAGEQTLRELEENHRIVFRYLTDVNGSSGNIAGVCNEEGNVVGMMPHPERAAEAAINPSGYKQSSLIFESLIKKAGATR